MGQNVTRLNATSPWSSLVWRIYRLLPRQCRHGYPAGGEETRGHRKSGGSSQIPKVFFSGGSLLKK